MDHLHDRHRTAISIKEAARRASCGRTSIYKFIKQKRLVAKKAGSRTLIEVNDLDAFLASLPRVHPNSEGDQ